MGSQSVWGRPRPSPHAAACACAALSAGAPEQGGCAYMGIRRLRLYGNKAAALIWE
jgi:hypothetical protein